jgi:hypothetical protein
MAAHAFQPAEQIFATLNRRQEQQRQHRHSRVELEEALEALADELVELDADEQRCWSCPACAHVRRIRSTTA